MSFLFAPTSLLHRKTALIAILLAWSASCTMQEPAAIDPLDPEPSATDTLVVAPQNHSMRVGESVRFRAPDTTIEGTPLTGTVRWVVTGGSGATIDSTGLFAAQQSGDYTVQATRSGHRGRSRVQVAGAGAVMVAVRIAPASITLQPGASFTFGVTGVLSDSSTVPVTATYTATGGTIASDGIYRAGTASGSFRVIATQQGGTLADTAAVTISQAAPTLEAVVVSPSSVTLGTGASQQFSAVGRMSDASSSAVAVTWTATGGTVNSAGSYVAGSTAGTFRVIAVQQGGTRADTATVTITSTPPVPTLQAVEVTPASVSLIIGGAQQFSAVGRLSDGSTSSVSVTWSATGGTVSSSGNFTAGASAGSFRVIATQQGGTRADTATVTISAPAPTLQAVVVSPGSVNLAPGASQQFSASGLLSDGSTSSVTVTWSSTGGTISGSGAYTAGGTDGTFRVIAVQQGGTRADTATVTIATPPPTVTLQAVEVSPTSANVLTGGTQQFSAIGRMSDGSTSNVAVTWTETGGSISGTGLYTAGSTAGSFRVIAVQQGGTRADTASITVSAPAPTLQSIAISPASVALATGGTQQFSVVGQMSDGSTSSVSVTYSATGGSVSGAGLYTAGGTAGAFRVIAVQQGGTRADTASITITPPPPTLTAVEVSPASVSLGTGAAQQFSAIGRMSDNSTTSVSVTWSATGGTITTGGLYTAGSTAGAFRVIAVRQGDTKADTSAVTITAPAPTLVAVELTPASVTVAAGATQQFTAVGRMSDNSTTSVAVTYTATGGTVTTGGLYTAGTTAGTFRVIAVRQGDTKADTSAVTITPPAPTLAAIEVTPATATVGAGATQQFSALGRMSDNSTTSVSVTWSATGGTITTGGLYTAGSTAGAFRVIAVRQGDTKADTSAVTVTASAVTLTAIEVTPSVASVVAGATQPFSALGRMSDNSTQTVTVTWSATGGTITTGGLYTAGSSAGTYRVIAVRQGDTKADTSVVTVTSGGTGGTLGTPDPTLLPSVDLTGTVTTKNPDYAAFQALDPRGKPSGWTYQDPVTGVTVVKLSAAGTPVSGNAHNWYSDGGAVMSHAWASGSDWYVTVMVYSDNSGQSSHLVDLKITGTPTLTNWRQLTGQLSPDGDLTFSFSSVPGTARIAYVANGGTLRRINTATMQVENTGNFPRAGVGDGAWLAVDKNDEWIVGMGSRTGQSAWAFNAQSGAFNTQSWSGMDEIRTDRAGGYAILGSGGYTLRLWDLTANTLAPTFTSAIPFAHNASLQGRFLGTNWDASFPAHIWRMARSGSTLTPTPNLYQNGFFGGHEIHWSGNWIQNVSNLDLQWAVCAGLDAYPGLWAKNAVGVVRADGQDARVLGHHYNTYGPDYWSLPFVNISAGGHVVTVNTRLAYSDNNTNNRTDLLAFIMPRSGGQ